MSRPYISAELRRLVFIVNLRRVLYQAQQHLPEILPAEILPEI